MGLLTTSELLDIEPNELLGNSVPFLGGLPMRFPVLENLAVDEEELDLLGLANPFTVAGEVRLTEWEMSLLLVSILSGFPPPLIGMILAGESFRGIGGILSSLSMVKSYALLFLERSAAVEVEVNDTLTPDMVEEVTLRSDLRPLLLEVVAAAAAAVGGVDEDVLLGATAEVTRGTEVTTTELLLGASLPFSMSTLAAKYRNYFEGGRNKIENPNRVLGIKSICRCCF